MTLSVSNLYSVDGWRINECRTVVGITIGRGNGGIFRKSSPDSLYPPKMPYDLTWDPTQAAVAGTRRLVSSVTTLPYIGDKKYRLIIISIITDKRNGLN
jgi:hypothetical protein